MGVLDDFLAKQGQGPLSQRALDLKEAAIVSQNPFSAAGALAGQQVARGVGGLLSQVAGGAAPGQDIDQAAFQFAMDSGIDPSREPRKFGEALSEFFAVNGDPERAAKALMLGAGLQEEMDKGRKSSAEATTAEAEAGVAAEVQGANLRQKLADAGMAELELFNAVTGKLSAADAAALRKARAEATKAEIEARQLSKELSGSALSKNQVTNVLRVRDKFVQNSKTYVTAKLGWEKVKAAAEGGTSASDLALVFGYMKTLDPRSIVTEGEVANVANSGSVPQRVRGLYNSIIAGETLRPQARRDIVEAARKQFAAVAREQKKTSDSTAELATRLNLPVELVVPSNLIPGIVENQIAVAGEGQAAEPSQPTVAERLDSLTESALETLGEVAATGGETVRDFSRAGGLPGAVKRITGGPRGAKPQDDPTAELEQMIIDAEEKATKRAKGIRARRRNF